MLSYKSAALGLAGVTVVALAKTVGFIGLALDLQSVPALTVLLIGMLFWVLTALVAVACLALVRRTSTNQRRTRIETSGTEEPGKENLVELHAIDWGLTKSETEVAVLVVKGFSNAEISSMRGSALQTVKSQLGAIYQKSRLANRYQLIAFITDEVCEASRASASTDRKRRLSFTDKTTIAVPATQ